MRHVVSWFAPQQCQTPTRSKHHFRCEVPSSMAKSTLVECVCIAGFRANPERKGFHCLSQLFGVAALAPRGLPPCRGFVREVPLAFPAPHLHAFGLWASMRYLVQVDR